VGRGKPGPYFIGLTGFEMASRMEVSASMFFIL
jgi:hypothetical protein